MEPFTDPFSISSEDEFRRAALAVFRKQYDENPVYKAYTDARRINPTDVSAIETIPFLPIFFFKSHDVVCGKRRPAKIFTSSGTTSQERSRHLVTDPAIYHHSLLNCFTRCYGSAEHYRFLALTPDPVQNPGSSLVYMIDRLMHISNDGENGFFLHDPRKLARQLLQPAPLGKKVILIGLTYALLDFAEKYPGDYSSAIILETGGMKGRRKEIIREELHERLSSAFNVRNIHSEYGMTELLSQAYSHGNGLFTAAPWMRILVRDPLDPLSFVGEGITGGINVIDLANLNSCSFIATEDLGVRHSDDRFEILGRLTASDARGCSLMM